MYITNKSRISWTSAETIALLEELVKRKWVFASPLRINFEELTRKKALHNRDIVQIKKKINTLRTSPATLSKLVSRREIIAGKCDIQYMKQYKGFLTYLDEVEKEVESLGDGEGLRDEDDEDSREINQTSEANWTLEKNMTLKDSRTLEDSQTLEIERRENTVIELEKNSSAKVLNNQEVVNNSYKQKVDNFLTMCKNQMGNDSRLSYDMIDKDKWKKIKLSVPETNSDKKSTRQKKRDVEPSENNTHQDDYEITDSPRVTDKRRRLLNDQSTNFQETPPPARRRKVIPQLIETGQTDGSISPADLDTLLNGTEAEQKAAQLENLREWDKDYKNDLEMDPKPLGIREGNYHPQTISKQEENILNGYWRGISKLEWERIMRVIAMNRLGPKLRDDDVWQMIIFKAKVVTSKKPVQLYNMLVNEVVPKINEFMIHQEDANYVKRYGLPTYTKLLPVLAIELLKTIYEMQCAAQINKMFQSKSGQILLYTDELIDWKSWRREFFQSIQEKEFSECLNQDHVVKALSLMDSMYHDQEAVNNVFCEMKSKDVLRAALANNCMKYLGAINYVQDPDINTDKADAPQKNPTMTEEAEKLGNETLKATYIALII